MQVNLKKIDSEYIASIFKKRGREGHKGEFGHTVIFAGSLDYVGAPFFVSEAAVRSGSGLVTLFVYDEILEIMKIKLNEVMVKGNPVTSEHFNHSSDNEGMYLSLENLIFRHGKKKFSDRLAELELHERVDGEEIVPDEAGEWEKIERRTASIVFGSGMGKNSKTVKTFLALKELEIPLVIDADGLNILCERHKLPDKNSQSQEEENFKFSEKIHEHEECLLLNELKFRKNPTILTPHLGEFSRLTGRTVSAIKSNREFLALNFAREHGVILVLKDSQTLITDGEKIYLNDTGNASMSNGGMGDLLAGLIGSFISQGYEPLEGANLGCYLLGKTGEELSRERFIVNPRDILQEIPKSLKKFEKSPV